MSSPSVLEQRKLREEVNFLKGVLRKIVSNQFRLGLPIEINGESYTREQIEDKLSS